MKKSTVFAFTALVSGLTSAGFAATTITGLTPVASATPAPAAKTLNYAITLDQGTSATSSLPALAFITNKVTITGSGVYLSSLSPMGESFSADTIAAAVGNYLRYDFELNRSTWIVEANAWAGSRTTATNINLLNSPTFLWSSTYGNSNSGGTSTLSDFALMSFGGTSHILNLYKKPLNATEAANPSANMVGLSLDPTTRKLSLKGAFTSGSLPPDVIVLDGLNASIKINGNKVLTDSGVSANVGIGTNTPSARLTVKSTGTSTASSFNVVNSADTVNFTILDNGNVGIGTNTPSAKLAVSGGNILLNNTFGLRIKDSTGAEQTVLSLNAANNVILAGSASSNLYLRDSLSLSVASNGFVGVGVTSPTSKFHVNGDTTLGGNVTITGSLTAPLTGNATGLTLTAPVAATNITLSPANRVVISNGMLSGVNGLTLSPNGSTPGLHVNAAGDVGIGNNTPAHKMDVAGNVKITGNPALNNGNALVVDGKTVAQGEVTLEADVKVKNNAVIRISKAGDLSMGEFTDGLDPLNN